MAGKQLISWHTFPYHFFSTVNIALSQTIHVISFGISSSASLSMEKPKFPHDRRSVAGTYDSPASDELSMTEDYSKKRPTPKTQKEASAMPD